MISLTMLVWAVVYILVAAGVCWLLIFLIDYWKPPEPFAKIAKGIVVTAGVIILIFLLISFVSGNNTPIFRP
jgi:hypothetical protein